METNRCKNEVFWFQIVSINQSLFALTLAQDKKLMGILKVKIRVLI